MSSSVPGTQGRRGNEKECVVASIWTLLKVLALFIPLEKSKILFSLRSSSFGTWTPVFETIQVSSCWQAWKSDASILVSSPYSRRVSESLFQVKPSLNGIFKHNFACPTIKKEIITWTQLRCSHILLYDIGSLWHRLINPHSKKKFQLLKLSPLKKQKVSLRELHNYFWKLNDDFPQRTEGKGRCGADGVIVPLWRKNISTPCKNILIGLPSGKPAHIHKG